MACVVVITWSPLTCVLQRLMFHGAPGVSVEWAAVLYPAPLPQYEAPATPKLPEPPNEAAAPRKPSRVKKKEPLSFVGLGLCCVIQNRQWNNPVSQCFPSEKKEETQREREEDGHGGEQRR